MAAKNIKKNDAVDTRPALDYFGYKKLISEGKGGAFMLCGDEEYLMMDSVSRTRSVVCPDPSFAPFNLLNFSAISEDFDLSRISMALESPPVFSPMKLVELHDFTIDGITREAERDNSINELCALADQCGEDTVFLLCLRSDELEVFNRKDYAANAARLAAHFTPVILSEMSDSALIEWMQKHFKADGVSADAGICRSLLDRCGHSMYVLSSEISKLCEYILASGRDRAEKSDVANVTSEYTEFGAFDFADAISGKNYGRAREIFEVMKANRDAPELILASIIKVFADMAIVGELHDGGLNTADISKRIGMHSYVVEKNLSLIARTDHDHITRMLELCTNADMAVKSRAGDNYLVLDRLIYDCTR